MAAADKARFYLEQYVPELREDESKQIFTREEIASITSKRSDFEHTLNARGSTPADYSSYAKYEQNLDALRKKRCKRRGAKTTSFSGQRTVFFILDRATKKFPGEKELWLQYIDFCKKEKAGKKLAKVFTQLLRLHPRDYALWVLAAKHYSETQGDVATARSYLQRGLRFCKEEKRLYLEYARLEMVYLAKLAARRKILGLDDKKVEAQDDGEDMIALPFVTAADYSNGPDDEDAKKGVEGVNEDLLKKLANAPAFTGGIPIAIFDAATKQFGDRAPEVAEDFYDLVAGFDQVPSTPAILQHILDWLRAEASESVEAIMCDAKRELFGIQTFSSEFPCALGKSLAHIKSGNTRLPEKQKPTLAEKTVVVMLPFLRNAEVMDDEVVKVLETRIKSYLRTTATATRKAGGKPAGPAAITAMLRGEGREQDGETLIRLAGEAGLG